MKPRYSILEYQRYQKWYSRLPEHTEFLVRFKADVLFNEMHLTAARYFQLPNYVCYRDDKPGWVWAGSTGLTVKASLQLSATPPGCSLLAPEEAATTHRPRSRVLEALRRVIMVGELNCLHRVWNSSLTTANKKHLLRFAQSRGASVIDPVEPTFYSLIRGFAPDVLDVAFFQGILCSIEVTFGSIQPHIYQSSLSFNTQTLTTETNVGWSTGSASARLFVAGFPKRFHTKQPMYSKVAALFYEAVVSAIDASTRMSWTSRLTTIGFRKRYFRRR